MRGRHGNNRRDLNEKQIFDIIRAHGIQVYPTDQPADAVCGFRGVTFLVEVKNGPKAPLTGPQIKFLATWEGQHQILCTDQEAIDWCKHIRKVAQL